MLSVKCQVGLAAHGAGKTRLTFYPILVALRDVFSWKERRRFTLVIDHGSGIREQLLALYDCFARTSSSIRQAAFTLQADLDEFLITPPLPPLPQISIIFCAGSLRCFRMLVS